ncbi:MAG: Uma2 family endonuclease [Tildeniella torsiva UHER 1998/13D]|jgi:Uma2 family endonuclease|nr:Uma2 family endonuclease [Tildeniella torsiva UHER 1998/13D]
MVTSAFNTQASIALGEKRVTLRGLDWQAYQQIYQALPQTRAARFTYDRGALEITMPLEDHEFAVRLIELFIRILVVERGLKIKTLGSTTLDREDLNRGAEPDNAYYIQNQPLVMGKTIDLQTDPPPDLVVEVDITHTDIDKLSLYANLGISEFWRYNGKVWRIYQLENGAYREVETSLTFPIVAKANLYEFLAQAKLDEVDAEITLRQWLRSLAR